MDFHDHPFELHDATFRDCLEFLRQKAHELADSETGLAGTGNFVAAAGVPADRKITLLLSNVSFADAVRAVAKEFELEARVDPCALCICKKGALRPEIEGDKDDPLLARLNKTVIPKIEFDDMADVDYAVPYTTRKVAANDSGGAGGISVATEPGGRGHVKISLQLEKIPALEVYRYIAEQAGLKVKFEPGRLVIYAQED